MVVKFKSLDNVRMRSNNAPEKWAGKLMNNAEMGNIIPTKSRNNTALENLNIRVPRSWLPPPPSSVPPTVPMEPLGPLGTRSGLGMLPNLKKPLISKKSLVFHANAPEWVPPVAPLAPYVAPKKRPSLPPPPPNSLNIMELVEYMKDEGRIYKKDYTPEAWKELGNLIASVRDEYDIHLFYKDGRNGPYVENPYYYIGHRTTRRRSPFGNMGQSNRGVNRTYRVRERRRKQTRRYR